MADNLTLLSVDNFSNDLNQNLIKKSILIADLTAGNCKIVDILEGLGSVLTNENKDIRRRGVEFLSWLLSKLSSGYLSEKEVFLFATFYCDRLKDHHSITPATLKGILTLVANDHITEVSVKELVHNIFQFVTCQAQQAEDRHTLYQIVELVSQSHIKAIEDLGPDFLYGVISSMEGETNPQNLILLLNFMPTLLSRLQVDHLTMDVFEVFSTYFPVDFNAKDNITRDDLAEGLSRCLTSTTKLAAECLPLILEKLDSTLKVAKLDSYKLLEKCCGRLNGSHFESHLNALWRMLHKDLLPALDKDIQRQALLALSALTGAIDKDAEMLEKFLDDIVIAIHSLVSKPRDGLFGPSMKILEALCPHSHIAARRSFLELRVLCRPDVHSESDLLVLLLATVPFIDFMPCDEPALLAISNLCLKTARESKLTSLLDICFVILQKLFGKFGDQEQWRTDCYNVISHCLAQPSTALNECYQLLRLIAKSCPNEVQRNLYAKFESEQQTSQDSVIIFLDVCAALVDVPELTDHVIMHYDSLGRNSSHSFKAIKSLLNACENNCDETFFVKIFDRVVSLANYCVVERMQEVVEPLSLLLRKVFVCRLSDDQARILNSTECWKLLTTVYDTGPNSDIAVQLVEGLLGVLRPDVTIPLFDVLLSQLQHFSLNSDSEKTRESSGRLLATFINKMPLAECQCIMEQVTAKLDNATGNKEYSVTLFCWALKGCLFRGHPQVDVWLAKWFILLDDPSISQLVAQLTSKLLHSDTHFLNEISYCTVRYLYKQRVFYYINGLIERLQRADSFQQSSFLLTALTLARDVPQHVIKSQQQHIALVVSLAMKSSVPQVVELSLNLLETLLKEKNSLFVDHIKGMLLTLLDVAKPPTLLRGRRAALSCLYLAAAYPTQIILPYRTEVVRGLVPCLDDHKRLVRSDAAKARARWFLVGAPGEDQLFP